MILPSPYSTCPTVGPRKLAIFYIRKVAFQPPEFTLGSTRKGLEVSADTCGVASTVGFRDVRNAMGIRGVGYFMGVS